MSVAVGVVDGGAVGGVVVVALVTRRRRLRMRRVEARVADDVTCLIGGREVRWTRGEWVNEDSKV